MTSVLQTFTNVRRHEAVPTFVAGLFFFCVLTALMVVRPAREALGMQRGIDGERCCAPRRRIHHLVFGFLIARAL